ncbi:copper chaperone PCu(A)C [Crenalkalicoccus roseus]|uniref:copper chaperone PCu(A)C n=1 Tax=Crenalkalicoccus roseus TaxID=1485588 RepID=UPI001080062A|nr:copper chaperone PCu(A)C [Crenalkalicoccus roseus]
MIRRIAATRRALLGAAALLPLGRTARAEEIRIGDLVITRAWSRAAPQGGSGAGYLAIANRGAAADRLVAAASPAAGRVELHTHEREGEVMRMREVPAIEIPPGETVTLRPGGLHLMLIGLLRPLHQGETVPVTLRFERAGEVEVPLAIAAAGAREPGGHGH